MPGKNPHRPEGKANADNEHMKANSAAAGMRFEPPSAKERQETDRDNMARGGGASRFSAEEQIGGSRPGVRSRMKEGVTGQSDDE